MLVDYRQAWGEDRVYFTDDEGRIARMAASWTDVIEADVHVVVADGRADFRADDLGRLAHLIRSVMR